MRMSRVIGWIVCIASLFVLSAPVMAESSEDEARELLAEGKEQYESGQWLEARATFEEAEEAAPDDSTERAEALLELSSLLWEQGNYASAEARVDEALELARKLDLHAAIGQLLLTRGHIQASQGRLASSEQTLKLCMNLAEEEGDKLRASLCKLNHRLVRDLRGRPTASEAEYREALKTLEEVGTPLSVGSSLSKTAELYGEGGDHERALELYEQAQGHFDKAGSKPAQLRNRLKIARHLQDKGDHDAARKKLDGLVEAFEGMNNRPALVDALTLTGFDALERGDHQQAKKRFERALSVAGETGSASLEARSHLGLCEFGNEAGVDSGTAEHCEAAATAFESVGIPELEARSRSQLAAHHQRLGEHAEASTQYSKAIEILEKSGGDKTHESALINYRANLCQVEMSMESNGAHYICQRSVDQLESQEKADPSMVAATTYAVGVTASREGKTQKGARYLKKAAERATTEDYQNPSLAADALLRRGALLAEQKDKRDEAADDFETGLKLVEEADDDSKELDAARIELRTQLAQLELGREKWSAAKEQLEALVDETEDKPGKQAWAHHALARAQLKSGDRDEAKKSLEAALPLAKAAGDDDLVEKVKESLEQFD
ncbi:MAG: tetratricopeptide repeat protein [Persicimonas sp.]